MTERRIKPHPIVSTLSLRQRGTMSAARTLRVLVGSDRGRASIYPYYIIRLGSSDGDGHVVLDL